VVRGHCGQVPPDPDRAGQVAQDTPVAHTLSALDTDEGAKRLGVAFAEAFGSLAPATRLRHLSTLRSAIAWWQVNGWLKTDPTTGWPMPKVTVDTTRALSHHNVASLWRLDVGLREKTVWKMLYESAARAEEILSLNIEDLDLPNKQARVVGKGGNIQWIHWQSGTAHLLPRLIAGRTRGPVFLADRLPTNPLPPWTFARPPAGPGCRTAARRRSSSWSPGGWRTREPEPKRWSSRTGGRCTSYATQR
jgi:integrase